MLRVELGELKEGIDVVRVLYYFVLSLEGIVFLSGLEPNSSALFSFDLELLPYLEELSDSWGEDGFLHHFL